MWRALVLATAGVILAAGCGPRVGQTRRHGPPDRIAVQQGADLVVVRQHPPSPREEWPGPPPSHRHVWLSGYWHWVPGAGWQWQPGTWSVRPHRGAVWVSPSWDPVPGGWAYRPGHWR